jgi:uncharacterized protein (TIGR02145 family)
MKHLVWLLLALTVSSYSQTPGNGVTDIDGNNYNSVIIGSQEWQKENLNVSKYTDGTIIPEVTDPTQWASLTTGAWCYYNNDPANGAIYGKLYNWYAVAGIHDNDPSTPNKILAPQGWHVSSDAEWTTLIAFLGGESVAGGKMKSTGTSLWLSPNTAATNESGFSCLPGGCHNSGAAFNLIGINGFWWSSSENNTAYAWLRIVSYGGGIAYRNYNDKKQGYSVRCVRDIPLSNTTFETNSIKLYPNPVNRVLNVNIDNYLISQPYTIIDNLGRVVLNGKLNDVESTINVEQLSKGIYYLKIAGNNATKFIKE